MKLRLIKRWRKFWLRQGGPGTWGRLATGIGSIGVDPFRGLFELTGYHPKGYIAPSARIVGVELIRAGYVFIGERVLIARWSRRGTRATQPATDQEGFVDLGEGVQINRDSSIEVLEGGGAITIGAGSGIQPRCLFISAVQPIRIGRGVQIAPGCSFFSYDHGIAPGQLISQQPLTSRGPIVIEDDAWLGVGVTVLSGVRIGAGAVVGAGTVITRDVPAGAVVVGASARIVKHRREMAGSAETGHESEELRL